MNVQHEDVVCNIFPYTFENTSSTWYFNLPVGSITSWTKFQKDFLDKFAEETTIRDLMVELFAATMNSKEKVKEFNPGFTTILKNSNPKLNPLKSCKLKYMLTLSQLLFPCLLRGLPKQS
jgi:hypothetical protein